MWISESDDEIISPLVENESWRDRKLIYSDHPSNSYLMKSDSSYIGTFPTIILI